MNKKILYAVIAVIVVLVLIIAVLEIVVVPTAKATLTVSVSSSIASVGQNLTFTAFISGGTPSKVIFNFGDGITGSATHLTGNEYTVSHSYSSAGKYLITANATVNGKYLNNLNSIDEISVAPAAVSPTIASETTVPSIIMPSQIVSPGSTVTLTASTLQPPTATNWTIGYYIWSFGAGATYTNSTAFNTTSEDFMTESISHLYSTAGIFAVTLGVITFNAANYVPANYTVNGNMYTYYPTSKLSSILTSGNYYNNTYMATIVVNSTALLLSSTVPVTNPNEIIVTEVQPGGPGTLDPAIDYDPIGEEVLTNIYETLLQYNGSSTTSLFPMIASEIPTVANGGISPNYLNYTFNIRPGLKFANGDPLTAWDVYTTYIRALLFVTANSGPPDWIIAQDLLPGGGWLPNATSYQNVTNAVTVNNVTQTVTCHLLKPDPAFFDYVADPQGASIIDYNWLAAHGGGITFTPAGFAAYMNEGNVGHFNAYIEYNAMSSGPYMIKTYLVGQSMTLMPNPYYTPIPGVPGYDHPANDTIYIQWEKDPATALLIAKNGLTDIVCGLPNYDYPVMANLQSEGKISITTFPSLGLYFLEFNFDINESMLPWIGSGYSIPQYYFANQDVRRAWVDAFNYTNYIDNLVGNSKYGADFAFSYAGIIPKGMVGYMNNSQLQQAGAVVPTYDLTMAKQYMEESGEYNISINIPIVIFAGDPIDFAAAQNWATVMNGIDPNIHATALYMEFEELVGYMVPYEDPMPINMESFLPDYPFPSDYVVDTLQESMFTSAANGWTPQVAAAAGQTSEANNITQMNNYIGEAENTANYTLAVSLYDKAEVVSVNLTLMLYLEQVNAFWFYSSILHGVQYEENAIYGGEEATIYIYLFK